MIRQADSDRLESSAVQIFAEFWSNEKWWTSSCIYAFAWFFRPITIVIPVKFAEIVTRGFSDLEELPVETVSWSRSGTCMKWTWVETAKYYTSACKRHTWTASKKIEALELFEIRIIAIVNSKYGIIECWNLLKQIEDVPQARMPPNCVLSTSIINTCSPVAGSGNVQFDCIFPVFSFSFHKAQQICGCPTRNFWRQVKLADCW